MKFWLEEPDLDKHFKLYLIYTGFRCINMALIGYIIGTLLGWGLLYFLGAWY